LEEVIKRPTATEVDDYTEYKRLRKLSRDGKRDKGQIEAMSKADLSSSMLKAAPSITPISEPLAAVKTLQIDVPPSAPRRGMFKRLHFDEEAHVHFPVADEVVSPRTISDADPLNMAVSKNRNLAVPIQPSRINTHGKADASSSESRGCASPVGSNASSVQTAADTIPSANIREVAPWIDYDAGLTMPSPPDPGGDTAVRHERPIITQSSFNTHVTPPRDDAKSIKAAKSKKSFYSPGPESPSPVNEPEIGRHKRRKSGGSKNLGSPPLSPMGKGDSRKSIFVRRRNPAGKFYDGVEDVEWFGYDGQAGARPASLTAEPTTPMMGHGESVVSWSAGPSFQSSVPARLFNSDSPSGMARRHAISPSNVEDIVAIFATASETEAILDIDPPVLLVVQQEDPFLEAPAPWRPKPTAPPNPEQVASIFTPAPTVPEPKGSISVATQSECSVTSAPTLVRPPKPKARPMAMRNLITASRTATPLGSPITTPTTTVTTPILERPVIATASTEDAENSLAEARLRGMLGQIKPLDIKVVFRDPFGSPVLRSREGSMMSVAPDVVVGTP
jgi:hypothetical protein